MAREALFLYPSALQMLPFPPTVCRDEKMGSSDLVSMALPALELK